ncbi:hypothetical protein CCAX7_45010 [Capsulimonas corticalis]|uniref:Uncharacterized protein n=1 Tax=Capsulimonas corticalis TaxID=2219043 RepID=A0A402D6I8_9BACT|nr:hypothetical protein [Capsulimonas corticalis]BDI32450.1 hypothetical protein CCAX7_45010 [Capsulimonas corticalis]
MKLRTIVIAAMILSGDAGVSHAAANPVPPPPASVTRALGLSPFYRKCLMDDGFAIVSSAHVSDYALREAKYLIDSMLEGRGDIRKALIRNKVRFAVQSPTEMTTAIPENRDLTPASYWDKRARGLGPTPDSPAVSCGEENLLDYPGDPYRGENILVHEFSHAIAEMGLPEIDPGFHKRLKACYDGAMKAGLFHGFYAATNLNEYWAEGVQSHFNCNGNAGPDKRVIATREDLKAYDPDLEALIASVFPNRTWRYVPVKQRLTDAHLRGFDPAKSPRFAWPKALLVKSHDDSSGQQRK